MVAQFEKRIQSAFSRVRKGEVEIVDGDFSVHVAEKKVTITAPGFTYETTLSKVQQSKIKVSHLAKEFEAAIPKAVETAPEPPVVAPQEIVAPEASETAQTASETAPRKRGPRGPRSAGTDYDLLKIELSTTFKDRPTITRKELLAHMNQKTGRSFSIQPGWSKDVVTKKHGTMIALLPSAGEWGVYTNPCFMKSNP
jgi:hypothetical protein